MENKCVFLSESDGCTNPDVFCYTIGCPFIKNQVDQSMCSYFGPIIEEDPDKERREIKMDKCDLEKDPVTNPSHYKEGRQYEPRKVIHDWGLNFNLGNAVKYISRAGRKGDTIEDLKKAMQYIKFELEELEGEKR